MADSFEVKGLTELRAQISAYSKSLRTTKPLFDAIEAELDKTVNESLAGQKSATTGRAYKPLTPTTVFLEKKPANTALQSKSGYGRITVLRVTNGFNATIDVSIPYAPIHQFGNPNNKLFGVIKAPIAARPYLPIKKDGTFTEKFMKRIEEITMKWLESKKRR